MTASTTSLKLRGVPALLGALLEKGLAREDAAWSGISHCCYLILFDGGFQDD